MFNLDAQDDSNSIKLELQKPIEQQKRLKSVFEWGIYKFDEQNRGHLYLDFNVKYLQKVINKEVVQVPTEVRQHIHMDCLFFAPFDMDNQKMKKGSIQFFYKSYKGLTIKIKFTEKQVPYTKGYLKCWYKDPSEWKSKGFPFERLIDTKAEEMMIKLNASGMTTRHKKQKQRVYLNEFEVCIASADINLYLRKEYFLMDFELYDMEPQRKEKFKGIMNTGNICYSNSLVQVLFFIRPLRKLIIEGKKRSSMMVHLQELFCQLASKEIQGPLDPLQLMRCFADYDQHNPKQQDIHQFMMIFFAQIQEEQKIVKDFWQGQGKNITQAKDPEINYRSEHEDIFNQLDIHITDHKQNRFKTIYQSLQYLMHQQNVQQQIDTQQHGRILVKKRRIFHSLPNVLFLNLKRYAYDPKRGSLTKVLAQMQYPETINLSFMYETPIDEASTENQYSLYAITIHKGRSPHHGHYYSFINTSEDKQNSDWYLFNDSTVKPANLHEILKKYNGRRQKCITLNREFGRWEQSEIESDQTAYMLVYLRDQVFQEYQKTKCKIPPVIIAKQKKKYKQLQADKVISVRVAVIDQTNQGLFIPFQNDQDFTEIPLNKEQPIKPQIWDIQGTFLAATIGTIWKVNINKRKIIYCGRRFMENLQPAEVHCGFKQGHNIPDYLMLIDYQLSAKNIDSLQKDTNLAILHIRDGQKVRFEVVKRQSLDSWLQKLKEDSGKDVNLLDNEQLDFTEGWNDYCQVQLIQIK